MQLLSVTRAVLSTLACFIAVDAFAPLRLGLGRRNLHPTTVLKDSSDPSFETVSGGSRNAKTSKTRRARDLILSLVEEEQCYTSETGARAFGDACAANVLIEDRFYPQPFVGKTVSCGANAKPDILYLQNFEIDILPIF